MYKSQKQRTHRTPHTFTNHTHSFADIRTHIWIKFQRIRKYIRRNCMKANLFLMFYHLPPRERLPKRPNRSRSCSSICDWMKRSDAERDNFSLEPYAPMIQNVFYFPVVWMNRINQPVKCSKNESRSTLNWIPQFIIFRMNWSISQFRFVFVSVSKLGFNCNLHTWHFVVRIRSLAIMIDGCMHFIQLSRITLSRNNWVKWLVLG